MTGNVPHAFLEDAAKSLLNKDASQKGRYVPLAAVARRLGAKRLLCLAPDLLATTLNAMKDDSVCTAAGALVAAVSQSLLFETTTEEEDAAANEPETETEIALPGAKKAEKCKLRRAGKDENTVAAVGDTAPDAIGLFLVRATSASMSRSQRSFTVQPAPRSRNAPAQNSDDRYGSGGHPGGAASAMDQRHGHASRYTPAGRSNRTSLA